MGLPNSFQCYQCSGTFETAASLKGHVDTHDIPKVFQCGLCGNSFHENSDLLFHLSLFHGGLPILYNCNFCKTVFQTLTSLEEHVVDCERSYKRFADSSLLLDVKENPEVLNEEINKNTEGDTGDNDDGSDGHYNDTTDFTSAQNSHITALLKKPPDNSSNLVPLASEEQPAGSSSSSSLVPTETSQASEGRARRRSKRCSQASGPRKRTRQTCDEPILEPLSSPKPVKEEKRRKTTEHTQTVKKETANRFTCAICSHPCRNSAELKAHYSCHTVEECHCIQCMKCNRFYDDPVSLEEHLEETGCEGFRCSKCDQTFGLEATMLRHNVFAHKRGPGVEIKCSECNKEWPDFKHLAYHEATHAKSLPPYVCKICGKRFTENRRLTGIHLPEAHNVGVKKKVPDDASAETGDDADSLKCRVCGHLSGDVAQLKAHISTHWMEDCFLIKCTECNVCFDDLELLENHVKDSDCRGFVCTDCGESFGLEVLLIKHKVLVHRKFSGEKLKCSQCNKKFGSPGALSRHETTHAKSLPYVCKLCDKHINSLTHILRYHLPNTHKVTKRSDNKEDSVPKGDEASGHSQPPNDKKLRLSTRRVTLLNKEKGRKRIRGKRKPKVISYANVRVCVDCDLCGGKVPDSQSLAAHRAYHFMEGKYSIQCSGCPEVFAHLNELTYHVQQKQCSQYRCNQCLLVFPTQLSFVSHNVQNHTMPLESGVFQCLDCGLTFDSHSAYVDHAAEHVTAKPFQCKVCNNAFSSMAMLENHLNKIHTLLKEEKGDDRFECLQCLATFFSKEMYLVHRKFHYRAEEFHEDREDANKPATSFASYLAPFFCNICSVGFPGSVSFEKHKRLHGNIHKNDTVPRVLRTYNTKRHLCSQCGKTFSAISQLTDHQLAYHSAANPFQCQYCHKFYSSRGTLKFHLRVHTGDARFECKLCGMKFVHTNSLEVHMSTKHSVGKVFKCALCDYECRLKTLFQRHMDQHYGIKRFKCPFCNRCFSQHNQMASHKTIHTGERKYACSYCGKTFARKQYLTVHTRTHTKEKPFACPACPSTFAVRSNLNGHVRKVHGEDMYKLYQQMKTVQGPKKEF